MQIVERLTPPAPPPLKLAPEPSAPEPSGPEPDPIRPRYAPPIGNCPKCGTPFTGMNRRCRVCSPYTSRPKAPAGQEPETAGGVPVVGPWLAREFEAARKVAEAVEGLDREAINRVFLHVLAAVAPAESEKTER